MILSEQEKNQTQHRSWIRTRLMSLTRCSNFKIPLISTQTYHLQRSRFC